MRNLFTTLFALGLATVFSSFAVANNVNKPDKPEKVLIAHLAETVETIDELTEEVIDTTYYYNIIEVSEKSLSGHSGHGDVLDGEELPDGTIWNAGDNSKGDKIEVTISETETET